MLRTDDIEHSCHDAFLSCCPEMENLERLIPMTRKVVLAVMIACRFFAFHVAHAVSVMHCLMTSIFSGLLCGNSVAHSLLALCCNPDQIGCCSFGIDFQRGTRTLHPSRNTFGFGPSGDDEARLSKK